MSKMPLAKYDDMVEVVASTPFKSENVNSNMLVCGVGATSRSVCLADRKPHDDQMYILFSMQEFPQRFALDRLLQYRDMSEAVANTVRAVTRHKYERYFALD